MTIRILFLAILLITLSFTLLHAEYPPRIQSLTVEKDGDNVVLNWQGAVADIYGNALTVQHYNVYRGNSPGFVPDMDTGSNRIAQVGGTSFTDEDALLSVESYFYYVTAVSSEGIESLLPSNIGYKIRLDLDHDASLEDTVVISLPYLSGYAHASDLGGDAENISQVMRWDVETQEQVVWDQQTGTGTDFPIVAGEAYALVLTGSTTLNLVGSYQPVTLNLTFGPDRFNRCWVSLPYPNIYGDAQTLADDIQDTTKIARWDREASTYESWFERDGTWYGENFTPGLGEGVLVVITDDVNWTPCLGLPSVSASADPIEGLNSVQVELSGTADDKAGGIAAYQWDLQGDGVFDHHSAFSAQVTHTYSIPGTYYPTLLVTDTSGHLAVDYRTVTVHALELAFETDEYDVSSGEDVGFSFTISQPGLITVRIYDKDGNLVRTLLLDQEFAAGQHDAVWDGLDDLGELVADGEYFMTFAYTVGGETYTHDLRLNTGGQDITSQITNIEVSDTLSPLAGEFLNISYTLPQKALVTIVIRNQQNEVVRHLITEAPRGAGQHTELWDGTDDDGAMLPEGSGFFVSISAVSLADSAMIIKGTSPELTALTVSQPRFSPATNPYGVQDRGRVILVFTLNQLADVVATVRNSSGNVVRTITEAGAAPGEREMSWNGRNQDGLLLGEGLYMIHLQAEGSNGSLSNAYNFQVEIFY